MSCSIGDIYVGLTDDPDDRKVEHGDPPDWKVVERFTSERAARDWEKRELNRAGHCGAPGGAGWRYGYKYKVTSQTRE